MSRSRLVAGLAAALALAPLAAPVSASQHAVTATIDCGSGPIVVVSGARKFAPLVDRRTGRRYYPLAWDVKVGDTVVHRSKPGRHGRTIDCSYDDGTAVGTVSVKRLPRSHDRG